MNKLERELKRKRKASILAKKCGWHEPFEELPEEIRLAFLSKDSIRRISPKGGRKGFGRTKNGMGRNNRHAIDASVKSIQLRIRDREFNEDKLAAKIS